MKDNDRLTAILAGLARNPEFINTVGARYASNGKPSMENIVTALKQVEFLWGKDSK